MKGAEKMKKAIRIILVMAFVVALFATTALAANYEFLAEELKDMGVFKGTTTGFNLDREPTRAEAATMLVRLLGKEDFAAAEFSSGNISHPFDDVAEWADPYVAYLYSNNLTNGVGADKFGSDRLCSAQMYCTFALRALGYSDALEGDFSYEDALDFAYQKGIANQTLFSEGFRRNELVAISYQTLATTIKDEDVSLLGRLISDGATDKDSAKALLEKIDIYNEILSSSSAMGDVTAIDASITMNMSILSTVLNTSIPDITSDIKMKMTDSDMEAEIIMTIPETESSPKTTVKEWIKDGYIYVDDDGQKYKTPLDTMTPVDIFKQSYATASSNITGIYILDEISKTVTASGTEYTITFKKNLINELISDTLTSIKDPAADFSFSIENMEETIVFDKGGNISDVKIFVKMGLSSENTGSIHLLFDCDLKINNIGDAVSITFPDFSDFVLLNLQAS